LIGEIQHALAQALAEEQSKRGLTRTGIAQALNTDKGFVTRKLSGTSNMTLETLADLAYALERIVKVELVSLHTKPGANYGVPVTDPSAAATNSDQPVPIQNSSNPLGKTLVQAGAV
jgi:transcriptional regulator with XRE-family HTH domain